MLRDLHDEAQRVNYIFHTDHISSVNEFLIPHWTKYLSIVSAGFIEFSVRVIFQEYVRRNSNANVYNYAMSQLKGLQNPNPQRIESLVAAFNQDWLRALNEYWDGERRDAVASIMNNRNNAAHGRHMGTSIGQIVRYHQKVTEVITFLHDLVLDNRPSN
ncbi:MAG: hypothetical protein GVY13_04545 [Alphaproteobacteria bacterium]|jgi:hypothetical protein|nr:hypothetical protein [Alphaproteobacteria bacterium]